MFDNLYESKIKNIDLSDKVNKINTLALNKKEIFLNYT